MNYHTVSVFYTSKTMNSHNYRKRWKYQWKLFTGISNDLFSFVSCGTECRAFCLSFRPLLVRWRQLRLHHQSGWAHRTHFTRLQHHLSVPDVVQHVWNRYISVKKAMQQRDNIYSKDLVLNCFPIPRNKCIVYFTI